MKKVYIVTIQDLTNYGNRLQNFASQEILKQYGFKPYTIAFTNQCISALAFFKSRFYSVLSRDMLSGRKFNSYVFNRKIKFTSKKKIYKHKTEDYFAIGSDQVWNPFFLDNNNVDYYTLPMIDPNKVICISPSIGISSITDTSKIKLMSGISRLKNVSCREDEGSRLLNQYFNINSCTLIDPTLMLSAKEWDKIAKKPSFHNAGKKYILLYFLGNMVDEYKKIIKLVADKYDLEVIDVYDRESIYYTCGPAEFIWMVKNCSIMLTDSFHGSVFSYIYDKPFRIFKREDLIVSMNSRLVNLMNKLHLSNDIYINKDSSLDNVLEVHYDKSYLLAEQKKFKEYLDKAVKE